MHNHELLELAREVRGLAQAGEPLVEMFRHIQRRMPHQHSAFIVIRVFRLVFDVPLFDLTSLGNWVGFGSSNPGYSDEEMETRFGQLLRDNIKTIVDKEEDEPH